MAVFRQGNKPRIVLDNGALAVEFVNGVAEVAEPLAALLTALGYEQEAPKEVEKNDTDTGRTIAVDDSDGKPKRGRKPTFNG